MESIAPHGIETIPYRIKSIIGNNISEHRDVVIAILEELLQPVSAKQDIRNGVTGGVIQANRDNSDKSFQIILRVREEHAAPLDFFRTMPGPQITEDDFILQGVHEGASVGITMTADHQILVPPQTILQGVRILIIVIDIIDHGGQVHPVIHQHPLLGIIQHA